MASYDGKSAEVLKITPSDDKVILLTTEIANLIANGAIWLVAPHFWASTLDNIKTIYLVQEHVDKCSEYQFAVKNV